MRGFINAIHIAQECCPNSLLCLILLSLSHLNQTLRGKPFLAFLHKLVHHQVKFHYWRTSSWYW